MAYFLDPELAALTMNPPAAERTPRKTSEHPQSGNRRPNKFGKHCHGCGAWVPAQMGYLGKEKGTWVVYCTECP